MISLLSIANCMVETNPNFIDGKCVNNNYVVLTVSEENK